MSEFKAPLTLGRSVLKMGTLVHVKVTTRTGQENVEAAVRRAIEAFDYVERACSRFDEESELRLLCRQIGKPVSVSAPLFETLRFALTVADMTEGAFDPTLGRVLHAHGFHKHYLTGESVNDEGAEPGSTTFQDVVLDEEAKTVLLKRPMTLDLGAVAKGFAVDLAARELSSYDGFIIDAGGDLFVGGHDEQGDVWNVGIRHPVDTKDILTTLRVSDMAVCTSGGYERKRPNQTGGHHLIDPRTGESKDLVLSSTVIAPFGMMADAFSTVAFILGCDKGIDLLEEVGVDGLLVDASLQLHMTSGMREYIDG